MRVFGIQVGHEYLTRTVRWSGHKDNLGYACQNNGHVRVDRIEGKWFYVTWLMRDGSERKGSCLPSRLESRHFLVEVVRGA